MKDVIGIALKRALNAVGALTLLFGIGAFGLTMLAYGADKAAWVSVTVVGFVGAAEVFHRQRQAELVKRSQAVRVDDLVARIRKVHPLWHPILIKDFQHGGLKFHAMGFEELPIPLAVAGPLCPACAGKVAERVETRFPGRFSIEFHCLCGFVAKSGQTVAELLQEAQHFSGTPV